MKKFIKEKKLSLIIILLLSVIVIVLLLKDFSGNSYKDESYLFNDIFSEIASKEGVHSVEHNVRFEDGVYYIDAMIAYDTWDVAGYSDFIKAFKKENIKFDSLVLSLSDGYNNGEKHYVFKDRVITYKEYKKTKKDFK